VSASFAVLVRGLMSDDPSFQTQPNPSGGHGVFKDLKLDKEYLPTWCVHYCCCPGSTAGLRSLAFACLSLHI